MDNPRNQINPQAGAQEDNPEVLRAKAQQTRAEITETVHIIQNRLSPERMKQQMKMAAKGRMDSMRQQARMKADEWRDNVTERISSNPLPAVMTGIGFVWLMKQAVSAAQDHDGAYERYYSLTPEEEWPEFQPEVEAGRIHQEPGTAEGIRESLQSAGQDTSERMSQWKHQAQEYAGEWKSRAQRESERLRARAQARAQRTKGEVQHLLHDNPLAVGAMVFAMGAAIGLSLPRTRKENEWLGETRDHMIEQAKASAKEAGNKAKAMAGEFAGEVKSAAEEVRNETRTM